MMCNVKIVSKVAEVGIGDPSKGSLLPLCRLQDFFLSEQYITL